MRKSKFTEEQIASIVTQAQAGVPIEELCRKYGISTQTFYRWRSKFAGLTPSDPRPRDRQARQARDHHARQRDGVHEQSLRRVGVPRQGRARLHPAGPADGERAHRELQRPSARRVPQRELVRIARRGAQSRRRLPMDECDALVHLEE